MIKPVLIGDEKISQGKDLVVPCGITFTSEERISIKKANGCPINKRVPTKMSRASFVKICKIYQRKAKKAESSLTNWAKSHSATCIDCNIGSKVKDGRGFKAPYNINFIDICAEVINKKSKRKISITKMDGYKVLKIRKSHNKGKKVSWLAFKYKVSTQTIQDIVDRTTWRDI